MKKSAYYGNPFLGVFISNNERNVFVPTDVQDKTVRALEDELKAEVHRISIYDSVLLGVYMSVNQTGVILPHLAYKDEVDYLKGLGLNIGIIESKNTAVGNLIACNDKGAIVSSLFTKREVKIIEDALGVETVQMDIAGYKTVGSACVATNKGFVAHNDVSDDELKEIESVLRVEGGNGTVNFGFPFVKYGIIANSEGAVVGETTTGVEAVNIEQLLDVVKT